MEHFDIIIVGAGIAGCGLAYNLKKERYKGKILVLDKKGIGANEGYGYRILFEETIKKYKFPFVHKYESFNVGAFDEIYFNLSSPVYFIDYKKICMTLFRQSGQELRIENCRFIEKNSLKTDKGTYSFKYLIDCCGFESFLKNKAKKRRPVLYWINTSREISNDVGLSDKSFYYMFSDTGYFEEIYPLNDKIIHADWMYTLNPYDRIIPHNKTLSRKKNLRGEVLSSSRTILPVSPVPPLVNSNKIFLGDSFGSANPANGMGIKPILESSKVLSFALKRENPHLYESWWKKRFLEKYTRCVASKLDRYHSGNFLRRLKKYPRLSYFMRLVGEKNPLIFLNMLREEDFDIPSEIKSFFPRRQIIFFLINYFFIKANYLLGR